MRIDQPAFDATTFTKNRERLLSHEVADEFFAAVVDQARLRRYLSSDHFSVDGTLLEAWASHKSFKPMDGPPTEPPAGRNVEVQFHGEKRSNETHASTTDPESRLYRKSNAAPAKLCYAGHLLMEHRSALIVDAELTTADGYAERATAIEMIARLPRSGRRRTVAGDKGYDTRGSVADIRSPGFTPHVAQNNSRQRSAIDGRTTRHAGHAVSTRIRKRIEEPFGWIKRSAAAASSATAVDNATGPGSASPPPSTTSSASSASTPTTPDRHQRARPTPTNGHPNRTRSTDRPTDPTSTPETVSAAAFQQPVNRCRVDGPT
jgi:Transposase DDE domain